jgi:hypothetical protein
MNKMAALSVLLSEDDRLPFCDDDTCASVDTLVGKGYFRGEQVSEELHSPLTSSEPPPPRLEAIR